jgi:hypothetical protein
MSTSDVKTWRTAYWKMSGVKKLMIIIKEVVLVQKLERVFIGFFYPLRILKYHLLYILKITVPHVSIEFPHFFTASPHFSTASLEKSHTLETFSASLK